MPEARVDRSCGNAEGRAADLTAVLVGEAIPGANRFFN